MAIKVYVENLAKYTEGILIGEWLTLPMKEEELGERIALLLQDDEEWAIHDFEAPFLIDEYDDIFELNKTAAALAEYDDRLVFALCGCTDSVNDVVRILKESSYVAFFEVNSLRDVADELIETGYYGKVPPRIKSILDYDKLVRHLEMEGWHMQYEVSVAVLPFL